MKIYFNNFFNDFDLSPFFKLFQNVFNENIEIGTMENSDILFESVFGSGTLLYQKKWLYSFLFIGESDARLHIFLENGLKNVRLKDYTCILKGKSENDDSSCNVINFPLFVLYSYSFNFTYKFIKDNYDKKRFNIETKITKIPKKNICVIISNPISEGRNLFIEELNKKVNIDFAGNYKNNVEKVSHFHCSPGFIDFVSNYKVIISMENSKNDNYITEKILHGFAANTIPVYWGAKNVGDYFNEERFIHVKSFDMIDIQKAIDEIMMVLNNDDVFVDIINKPIYTNNRVPCTLDLISNNIKNLLNLKCKQDKYFITFGGPTENFHCSVRRLCDEAKRLEMFDEIRGFTEMDLKNDKDFWTKHGKFIESHRRGYGYWVWKPFLIQKVLDEIKENDILIYCDAGCQINIQGKRRLMEYIDMLNSNVEDHGVISFQLEFEEFQYTKQAVFDQLQYEERNTLQCLSGIQIYKKNTHSKNIIHELKKYCEHYNLIDDSLNIECNGFIENRHDQSVYSILVKKHGSIKLIDETYFLPNWETSGSCFPFWAKRIK